MAWTIPASAGLLLPSNMSKADREQALRIFALGSSAKILTDPHPLGGYTGLELGASLESLPVQEVSTMGDRSPSSPSDVTYAKLSIGKGLYEDIDVFFTFTPFQTQKAEISQYGGMLRWCFFQGARYPLALSALAQLSGVNVSDQITANTLGVDLVAGFSVDDVSLFLGAGPVRAQGSFVGGDFGVTDGDKQAKTEEIAAFHEMAGASVRIRDALVAVQVDRYATTILSAKLGLRF